MINQREDEGLIPTVNILSLFSTRIPAIFLLNRLIAPSAYLANILLWGFILPWAMLRIISKLNK